MTGWNFILAATMLISTAAVLAWYRVIRSQDRALLVAACSVVLLAPLITFSTLGFRLEFDWRDLGDSPADGLVLFIGAIETAKIWVGSITIVVLAHLTVMNRYSDHFHEDEDLSEFE
ncbi:MAG: hypothetical protein AAF692_08870 [Pseudomonadota bacterium]